MEMKLSGVPGVFEERLGDYFYEYEYPARFPHEQEELYRNVLDCLKIHGYHLVQATLSKTKLTGYLQRLPCSAAQELPPSSPSPSSPSPFAIPDSLLQSDTAPTIGPPPLATLLSKATEQIQLYITQQTEDILAEELCHGSSALVYIRTTLLWHPDLLSLEPIVQRVESEQDIPTPVSECTVEILSSSITAYDLATLSESNRKFLANLLCPSSVQVKHG